MLSFLIISIQEFNTLAKKTCFKIKDDTKTRTQTEFVYKISCQEPTCQQEYIGETGRHGGKFYEFFSHSVQN